MQSNVTKSGVPFKTVQTKGGRWKKRKTTGVVATRVNYGKWQIVQTQHTVHTHTPYSICVSNLFFVLYCAVLSCYCLVYAYTQHCVWLLALEFTTTVHGRCVYVFWTLCVSARCPTFRFRYFKYFISMFCYVRNGATPHTKKSRNKKRKKQQQQQRNKFHYEWNMFASNMKCAALQQPQQQLLQYNTKNLCTHTHTCSKHFQ